MDDELREIEAATRAVSAAAHTATDRMLPPATARAVLLAVAATMIATNMTDDSAVTPDVINAPWVELGFGWRLTRVQ
jgi:hypothetical protein